MRTLKGLFALALAVGALSAGEVAVRDFDLPANWKTDRNKVSSEQMNGPWFKVQGTKVSALNLPGYPPGGAARIGRAFTGIAFKVRGNGSNEWGRISILAGPMGGGTFYFPLKSREVTEFRVAFSDMAPNADNAFLPAPKITAGFQLGDRWRIGRNNAPRNPFTYEVSELRLSDDVQGKFVPGKFRPEPSLDGVIARMKAKKNVLILCFGDSITAGTGLSSKDKDRYAAVLQDLLRKRYGYDGITVRSVAVGGAHTFDSIAWLDRDLAEGRPDAATMLIGYNNRSGRQSRQAYAEQLERWIELFAMKTGGKAPVVLIPTVPGVPRFLTQRDMAEATREVACKYGLAVAPVDKAIEKLGPGEYRGKYLVDGVHPNPAGHKLFADILFKVFCK